MNLDNFVLATGENYRDWVYARDQDWLDQRIPDRTKGALIDTTMKEGRTRQGQMSTKIIHYIYRGWK